jgi:hypothetical protein
MNKSKEKSFENHESSCRLCLEVFRPNEAQDKLTNAIRKIFFELTSIQVTKNKNVTKKF